MPDDMLPFENRIKELRASELIRYTDVYTLKIQMLEKCFSRFLSGKDTTRRKAYEQFCRNNGESLQLQAALSMPVVALVLNYIAYRRIRADERLVRSADRLR